MVQEIISVLNITQLKFQHSSSFVLYCFFLVAGSFPFPFVVPLEGVSEDLLESLLDFPFPVLVGGPLLLRTALFVADG